MKLKYLLPTVLLAGTLSASAVPAWPGLMETVLEDGTKVMTRLHGDEYFSYITDEHGYLMENKGNVMAYKMADGNRVLASEDLLTQMRAQVEQTPLMKRMQSAEMKRMANLTSEGRTTFCTTGDVHFCVILVQYDDIKFTSPTIREDMDAMLNQEGYNKNGCPGSMRDYYIQNSNGKFTPTFDVSNVITLPYPSSYYTGNAHYERVDEMVASAVELADAEVDFSKYCNVTPGECDAVILWYAGYGQADTANTTYIWPHQGNVSSQGITADGVKIGVYCCFNELNGGNHYTTKDGALAGIGTPIHEFGHVMGMPDLYDPNYKVLSTPGQYSVFDAGPYLGDGYCPPTCSGYERWLFNWIEFEEAQNGTHYTLENLNGGGKALRIPVKGSDGNPVTREFWVVESRHKSNWDAYLPDQGMMIWHVDYDRNAWRYNTVNSNEKRKRCYIITADGSTNYDLGETGRISKYAAWPQKINYITPDTEITLKPRYSFATDTDVYIANIKHNDETGVSDLDYNVYTEQPADATVMLTPTRGLDERDQPNKIVTLTWEPVEGATDYMLTVYRQSGTKIYYENDLEETPVGNVTSYSLPQFSNSKMKLKYNAYVRVVKGLPSTEKSNEVTFIANDLEATGINDVMADENISVLGMKGAIQAPASAEIYNMQGVRCPATGLNPGVYVVRTGSKVTKVVVR